MNKQLLQVTKFMNAAGLPASVTPVETVRADDHDGRQYYARKQHEEYDRSFQQIAAGQLAVDPARALAALATRMYAVMTDAHSIGMAYLLPVAFQMLHESLMTTFWTAEEVDRLEHTQYHVEEIKTGTPRCFRLTDYRGKIVKSPGYTPPHISDLFESLAGQELFDFNHAIAVYYGSIDDDNEEEEVPPMTFPDLSDEEEVWKALD